LTNFALTGRVDERDEPAAHPFVSVIIPARNEARAIGATLRDLLAQDYDAFEVIVVDDRSADGTGAIARSFADPRLIVVDGEEKPAGWLGKPWALHQGSLRARGELLLFMDADIRYEPHTLGASVAYLRRRDLALLALMPRLVMHGFWENVAMPMMATFALTFLPVWLSNRTKISRLAIGGGPGNLLPRSVYDRIGGHAAIRDEVIDDVAVAQRVRRACGTTEAVFADRLVSVRMYHGAREIIEGFTKNVFAGVGRSYLIGTVAICFFAFVLIAPYVLVFTRDRWAIAGLALLIVTRVVLAVGARFRIDSAIFGTPLMAAFWIVIFVRSAWKTGVRRQLEWRGRRYDPR
jgi:chlorobactene glucosyltransferase